MEEHQSTAIALPTVATPAEQISHASSVAGACKAIVTATAMSIQGRKYVRVEGWQAIAIAHGCVASASNVHRVDNGFAATGEVRKLDTGALIATAEGFVGDDEKMWAGRPEYARRAMAQTRAISRACRSAFAHVVVMMNAGLETTPAEEIPTDSDDDDSRTRRARPVNQATKPGCITAAQAETLKALAEKHPDRKSIAAWLGATFGASRLTELRVDHFEAAREALADTSAPLVTEAA